ncbi:phosphopyruvate hydratase [Tubulinosema ratisbonensis]|uniref:phosphopyruvate hydratase n=1 Tax=Tubulinosema ratisbonensis TaxID=291195 RepID=A0A437AJK0_9MICR|nr:phosphopyruvate hydratase [Tubulinosema ratisbonensis]
MFVSDIFEKLICREIISSRGTPTVEIELHTLIGVFRNSSPIPHRSNMKLAIETKNSVENALFNINHIFAKKLCKLNIEITNQKELDEYLVKIDGTKNLVRLGINTIFPISIALCRAGAVASNLSFREHLSYLSKLKMKIPIPIFTMISKKEGFVKEKSLFEDLCSKPPTDFKSVSIGFKRKTFGLALKEGFNFFLDLKKVLYSKYEKQFINVSDEGSFYAPVDDLKEALEILKETAVNHNYKDYFFAVKGDFFPKEVSNFDIKFVQTNKKLEKDTLSEENHSKYFMVKFDKTGTISTAIQKVQQAKINKRIICVGSSQAETEDTFLSDFSVGIGADYLIVGAPCRGERVSKFNQILRIEENFYK